MIGSGLRIGGLDVPGAADAVGKFLQGDGITHFLHGADLEDITSAWVAWYNTSRLMHRLGRRPPAEVEAEYYQRLHAAEHPGHR